MISYFIDILSHKLIAEFVNVKPASHCPRDMRIGGSGGKSDVEFGQWEILSRGGGDNNGR